MSAAAAHVDTAGVLRELSLLSKTTPAAAEAIPRILACLDFEQNTDPTARKRSEDPIVTDHDNDTTTAHKRRAEETNEERRAGEEINKTAEDQWQCVFCDDLFSSKSSLIKHINDDHLDKRRRRLVRGEEFVCNLCKETFGTETTLRNHQENHHESYKCRLCHKECLGIHGHYESEHKVISSEQILYYDGEKLVHSAMDTQGGKAPWFIREKENATKRYNNVTCRFDEKQFYDAEALEVHYTLYHKVDPTLLNSLNSLFKAKNGSHLDVSASNPRHGTDSTPNSTQNLSARVKRTENKNLKMQCDWCHKILSNKANLKRHIITIHAKGSKKCAFSCNCCDKVYDSEALLNRHKNYKHTNAKRDKNSAKTDHNKKIVGSTCRLCEKDYGNLEILEQHYRSDHQVSSNALRDLLAEMPASQTPSRQMHLDQSEWNDSRGPDSKTKNDGKADSNAEHENQKSFTLNENTDMIVYQCEECEVTTTTYDACVEHAQLHSLEDYTPIKKTCHICKLMFDSIENHSCNHRPEIERKILKYNPSNLLDDDWLKFFKELPVAVTQQIMSSSVYQYTRVVKINSDEVSGTPLYQCGMCELFVSPKEVEEHCNNKNACVKNKTQNYYCTICEIYFHSSGAINKHHKDHNSRIRTFRKVKFNCREDATINRALQGLQKSKINVPHPDENPVGTQQEIRQQIEILDDRVVSVFCDYCKKSIMYSDFENHAATHVHRNITFQEDYDKIVEENVAENYSNSRDKERRNTKDVATQDKVIAVESNEGTVEEWDNDDDSCYSLVCSSYAVQAQVHRRREKEKAAQNSQEVQNSNSSDDDINDSDSSVVDGQVETYDCFTEEMASNLNSDCSNLFDGNAASNVGLVTDENLSTQELVNILES